MSSKAEELTIDEFARRAGLSVRNVREYQARGLLPPPSVRGRTGYYGEEHLKRLQLIRDLQEEGFSRKAIKRLLDRSSDAPREALGFARTVLTPFAEETPEVLDAAELEERLGGPFEPAIFRKAERAGLVRPLGDGRYEVPSPTLLRAGEQLVALGVPIRHALAVAERINRHSRAIAEAFVRLFVQDVFEPLQREGGPSPEAWAATREAVEQLRPLAAEALLAGFQQSMTRAVERAFAKALER
jgi:DNA-binding transcriptional MerR regulator